MKGTIKSCILMAVFLLVSGCATGPKFGDYLPKISDLPADSGRIYVYRTAVFGAAVTPEIKLNGEVIGKAMAEGFVYADRPPGNYEIMTSTEVSRKLSFTLEKGQTRYVRLNISIGFFVGHVYPELVEPQVGRDEIKGTRYTGKQ